jgi:Amt family ammonium transporter
VTVTAGCAFYKPYAGFIVGIVGGLAYYGCSGLLIRLRIDDPLDAIPIHFGGGLCGLICVGWFHEELGIFYNGGGKLLGI